MDGRIQRVGAHPRYLLTRNGSVFPQREGEAGWEGLRGSPRRGPSGQAPPGPPGEAPALLPPRPARARGRRAAVGAPGGERAGEMAGNAAGAEMPPWALHFFASTQHFLALCLSCCSGASLLFPTAGKQADVPGPPLLVERPDCRCCVVLHCGGPHSPPCHTSPSPGELHRVVRRGHAVWFFPSRISVGDTPCTTSSFFKKWPVYVGLCL